MGLENKSYTIDEIKELSEVLGLQQKHNPTAGADTFNYAHGPGGMFSEPGVRPEMYSALLRPRTISQAIPWKRSEIVNEKISILTGQLAATGTNATSTCGDYPSAGDLKKCTQVSLFGQLAMKTEKVDVTKIGRRNDRADLERQIVNMAQSGSPFLPDLLTRPGVNFMSSAAQALFTLGNMLENVVSKLEINGSAAVTGGASAIIGVIDEYDGIDALIKAGHTDVASGLACPAADSHILNWNTLIGGTVNGLNIMELLSNAYFSRKALAFDVHMESTNWALVMDKRLFRALAHVAACTYADVRCTDFAAGTPGGRTMTEIQARAEQYQQGQYIMLDTDIVPVLFTSGADVAVPDLSGNALVGDIRLVPMSWVGGDLLFGEYFPMDNAYIQEWEALASSSRATHNDGMFITAARSDAFCDEILLSSRQRLILDAPFLAARIDNITFDGYTGYRSPDPGATFFYDGGTTQFT